MTIVLSPARSLLTFLDLFPAIRDEPDLRGGAFSGGAVPQDARRARAQTDRRQAGIDLDRRPWWVRIAGGQAERIGRRVRGSQGAWSRKRSVRAVARAVSRLPRRTLRPVIRMKPTRIVTLVIVVLCAVALWSQGVTRAQGTPPPATTPRKGGNPEAAKLVSPVAATPESIAAGRRTYLRQCAGCHGPEGKGDGGGAGAGGQPADFTDDVWIFGELGGGIFHRDSRREYCRHGRLRRTHQRDRDVASRELPEVAEAFGSCALEVFAGACGGWPQPAGQRQPDQPPPRLRRSARGFARRRTLHSIDAATFMPWVACAAR